jgi:hypothetical protein
MNDYHILEAILTGAGLKGIFIALIITLLAVQLYRNFGTLLGEQQQMIKENLVILLVAAAAIFVYDYVGG